VFRPHLDARYATAGQLATEQRLVATARTLTAPALAGPEVELLRIELSAAGLGPDQVDAVAGIMSSGCAADVLIGPAGAGKSYTLATLAHTWTGRVGGRVLGLATSQLAANVLRDEGLTAMNITAFLRAFAPDHDGQVRDRVQPGDLFIVDETSMTNTADLARITDLVRAGGGKLVFTGDDHQLDAIGAGGLLELLVIDNGAHRLREIRRFTADWEGPASARLRTGDPTVLTEYDDRGRLLGGTVEQMHVAAVRGYLTDHLSGLDSLLIVATNNDAAQLAASIRDELIDLGRVDPTPLGRLRDGTQVSAGDLVQARRNDPTIPLTGHGAAGRRGWIINRETYTVLHRSQDGRLVVQRGDGAIARLPVRYVAAHLTLAYASTVHAALGRTVDTAHAVLGEHAHRPDAYVALTRGRIRNTASSPPCAPPTRTTRNDSPPTQSPSSPRSSTTPTPTPPPCCSAAAPNATPPPWRGSAPSGMRSARSSRATATPTPSPTSYRSPRSNKPWTTPATPGSSERSARPSWPGTAQPCSSPKPPGVAD
jgi:hypothetical protein